MAYSLRMVLVLWFVSRTSMGGGSADAENLLKPSRTAVT